MQFTKKKGNISSATNPSTVLTVGGFFLFVSLYFGPLPLRSFVYILCLPFLYFQGISVNVNLCVYISNCVSCAFLLAICFSADLFVFLLFSFVYFLDDHLLSNEREEERT